ncbi:MAG: antibiotic biosynthesis monooxygenase [Polyangiales bacterium]
MIVALSDIRIKPGMQREIDAAITRGLEELISKSPGYRGHRVQRGVDAPERYALMVYWESLEAHTVAFAQSPRAAQWHALVEPYLARPPRVEHFALLTPPTR